MKEHVALNLKAYKVKDNMENCEEQENYMDWKDVKDKICMRVAGTKLRNDLKGKAFMLNFLELGILLYVPNEEHPDRVWIVTPKDMRFWKTTIEEIVLCAIRNTYHTNQYILKSMRNYWGTNGVKIAPEYKQDEVTEYVKRKSVYVISTQEGRFGASAILFTDVFERICKDLNSNLYILPCSVHELILVPEDESSLATDELLKIVKEVNQTTVSEEDLLADNVYYFDRKRGTVEIAA